MSTENEENIRLLSVGYKSKDIGENGVKMKEMCPYTRKTCSVCRTGA